MGVTVSANDRSVVHKGSGGIAINFPDVCKTPSPAGPIPIPYPNIAKSGDADKGAKKVKVDGEKLVLKTSNFKTSTGDEAGSAKGLVSSKTKGKAEFVNYSFDIKAEGKNVPRLGDMMLQNKGGTYNTPPIPELQAPVIVVAVDEDLEENELQEIEPVE
jgi:hypothetical protein